MGVQLYRVEPFEHPQENAAFEILCRAILISLGEHDGREAKDSGTALEEAYAPHSTAGQVNVHADGAQLGGRPDREGQSVCGRGYGDGLKRWTSRKSMTPNTDTWAEGPAPAGPSQGSRWPPAATDGYSPSTPMMAGRARLS
jgi:hypothetical protein